MAILNNIRKNGIFLILIIALALFAFILSDILTSGGSGPKGQDTVATINGTDLSRQSFMEEVEVVQRNMGPNANTTQAMNIVWERELRRIIMEDQVNKVGITAEKAQLDNMLRSTLAGNPTFLNEAGQVDDGKIQEYIASIRASSPEMYQQWLTFEKNMESSIVENTYQNMIKGGLRNTLLEGQQEYHFENDKVNFNYLYFPYSSIQDEDIKISDDEIKKYITARSKEYNVDAQADIQYVTILEDPSDVDFEDAKTSIASLLNDKVEFNQDSKANDTIQSFRNVVDYENFVNQHSDVPYSDAWYFQKDLPSQYADTLINLNKGDIYGPFKVDNTYNLAKALETKRMPDSTDSKHILIRYIGTMRAPEDLTRTKEEANHLADSLMGLIKKDKSRFEELAREYSDDGSKEKGGDLGTSTPGRMVAPYNDFIFDNPTGTLGKVETDFGIHIVEVGKQSSAKKAVKLAIVTKNIEASENTINDVFSRATKFELAIKKENFVDAAKAQDLEVRPVNNLTEMESNIPGVGENRSIVTWAFDKKTKVGDSKRFNIPAGYVIAQVTQKNEKGLMPVSQAKQTITPILRNEKKAEKIRQGITGDNFEEIAKSKNVAIQSALNVSMANPLIPNAGLEPKVVGAVFGTKPGESTKLINGTKGVFKAKTTAFNPASKLDSYKNYAEKLSSKNASSASNSIFQALKKKADIKDNRAAIY